MNGKIPLIQIVAYQASISNMTLAVKVLQEVDKVLFAKIIESEIFNRRIIDVNYI